MSLLFYTAANTKYEFFTPLYLYFALKHNKDSFAEILLENAEAYQKDNSEMLRLLHHYFPNRFKLTTANFKDILPGSVRFINEPRFFVDCDYVYIGDIDILILDTDVEQQHVQNMAENNLPFSNIVRPSKSTQKGYPRLSGLHFAPMDAQYPLPNLSELDYSSANNIRGGDENILFAIMTRKGYSLPADLSFRPEHGIHASLKRYPLGRSKYGTFNRNLIHNKKQNLSWGGIENRMYRDKLLDTLTNEDFIHIHPHLDVRAKNILNILENIARDRVPEYKDEMRKFVIGEHEILKTFYKMLTLNR